MDIAALLHATHESKTSAAQRLREMALFLQEPTLWPDTPTQRQQFAWTETQKRQLRECPYLELVDEHRQPTATIFPRTEPKKQRHRVLLWPEAHNVRMRDEFSSTVKDTLPAARLGRNNHVRTFDMEAGFYQVELEGAIRDKLIVAIDNQRYRFTRLPMGICFAPDLLEAIIHAVIELANIELQQEGWNTDELEWWVHVDNIRIASASEEITSAAAGLFKQLCAKYKITISEDPSTPFLGMDFNYDSNPVRVRVKEDTITAIQTWGPTTTFGAFREWLSRCIYASRIQRIPLAGMYTTMKYARRIFATATANDWSEDHAITLWPCIHEEVRAWIRTLSARPWTTHHASESRPESVVFTDASTHGWGAILVDTKDASIHSAGGRWSTPKSAAQINELECQAVRNAAAHFRARLAHARAIHIVVDNSSTQYALRKGSAHAFLLNDALQRTLQTLPDCDIRVSYIPSGNNPADAVSRQQQLSESAVWSACGLVAGGWLAGKTALRVMAPSRRTLTT